jgi:hypothetical protein
MNMLLDQEFADQAARIEADYQNQSAGLAAAEQREEDKAVEARERASIICEIMWNVKIAKLVLVTAPYRSGAEAYQANAIADRALNKIRDLLSEIK